MKARVLGMGVGTQGDWSMLGRINQTFILTPSTIHFEPVLIVKKRDTSILSAQTRLVNNKPV
jgi:hypothetical protein